MMLRGMLCPTVEDGRGLFWVSFNELELLDKAQLVGEQAIELLKAKECPTEKTNLVIASDQMMLQIHESIGHALELDRILGDERNYAGWSFVKLSDFGKLKYGSDLLKKLFSILFLTVIELVP